MSLCVARFKLSSLFVPFIVHSLKGNQWGGVVQHLESWTGVKKILLGSALDETLVYLGSGVSQQFEIKCVTRKCEHPVLKRIGFCRRLTPKRCSWGAPQVDFWVQGQLIYALLSPSTFKYDFWSNNSDSRALLCTLSLIRLKENASEELLSPWRACRCGAGPRARRSTPQRRRRCIIRSLGSPDV